MRKVCIVSLKCAVGLQKEIETLCAGFTRHGWQANAILADGYKNLCVTPDGFEFVAVRPGYTGMLLDVLDEYGHRALRQRLSALQPDLILFYNQSPLNLLVAKYAKKIHGSGIAVCLHDPWKPKKLKYGLSFALLYSAVERLQGMIVSRADWVLTLSPFGTHMFRAHYRGFSGKHSEGRILLKSTIVRHRPRSCVSIIGRINPSTGHNDFLSLANSLRGRLPGVTFEIVTSSPIARQPDFLRRAEASNVVVRYKDVLTENEIEDAIARSICVFRLDQELTQSGVIPVCYRAGVPVVVRDIPGLRQHVVEGLTGFTYHEAGSPAELAVQLDRMQNDFLTFAENCRTAFEKGWAEDCFELYYGSALNEL